MGQFRTNRAHVIGALAAALALASWAPAVSAQSGNPSTVPTAPGAPASPARVAVAGEGVVRSAPDIATLTLGVSAIAKTAEEAVASMAEQMEAVLQSLGASGIARSDTQTGFLSLQPRYGDPTQPGSEPPVTGYEAINEVRITTRDLDRLGDVLAAAVSSGANRFGGVEFALGDPSAQRDEALRRAVAEARGKAQVAAQAAGLSLGPILTIEEGGADDGPSPMMEARLAAVPISPGEIETRVRVRIVFALVEAGD